MGVGDEAELGHGGSGGGLERDSSAASDRIGAWAVGMAWRRGKALRRMVAERKSRYGERDSEQAENIRWILT